MSESELAKQIRSIRNQQGLTLKELSARTSLSVSFLSQVERGTSSPAISSLKKIADGLEVPITSFFQPEQNPKYKTVPNQRRPFRIEGSPAKYIRLSGNFSTRTLESLLVILDPGATDKVFQHSGEEVHYILEGEVEYTIDNENHRLCAGDSIHFPSDRPHTWRNPLQDQTSTIMCVVTPKIF
ncbi:cupin domain-containing protein [Salipaludibacillus sp. CUR1]|uniref:cupin domain-containing protein n=1 Tax=Salipaludibacillus sp. CUR1 TaxID=2820003 RepID=UPI001E32B17F|nr:cupin domain-containing protein [Salipaludibacillus sp. CUR1]MCE7791681.1 cupin domain-containing protein [Salipaludibacillus sp. CUR1]